MDIEFRRGDTQFFDFPVNDGNGNPAILGETEKIYFTVKQNGNSNERLIQKKYPGDISVSNGVGSFVIESEDTADIPYGTYEYDIEFKSGKYVKTLGDGTITLTEEITHRSDEV